MEITCDDCGCTIASFNSYAKTAYEEYCKLSDDDIICDDCINLKKNKKKVILVGDGETGKTSFMNYLLGNDIPEEYEPTRGAVKYTIKNIDFWDIAGQEKYGGLRDGYFIGADLCLMFYDGDRRSVINASTKWYRDVIRVRENIPMIAVDIACIDLDEPAPKIIQTKFKIIKHMNIQELVNDKNKQKNIDEFIDYLNSLM